MCLLFSCRFFYLSYILCLFCLFCLLNCCCCYLFVWFCLFVLFQSNLLLMVWSKQESPTVIDAIASPLLPLDMMGTTLELHVQSLGGTALLAVWNVTSTATVTGFRFLLRRGNDSAEEADVTLRVEVTHYVLSGLLDQCVYETCVTVLGEKSLPMARDCVETTTGNHSTHSPALDEVRL